jgi:DNA-binding NtrC family response regulator
MDTLLLVDDEPNVLFSLENALASPTLQVITAESGRQAIEKVHDHHPDAVVLDVRLPDMSGLDAFRQIHEFDPRLPVTIITAHGTTETAIEAMKRGAYEYLLKPLDLPQLRYVVAKAIQLSRLTHAPAPFDEAHSEEERANRIVGSSAVMQAIYKDIGRVAPQIVNVLILGESGTGKELIARAIFQHSPRSDRPFLAINCAAIPELLLESELFGHERGAFTGADRRRIGKFEQADGGTIFLDEIGDMTLSTQAKILRMLQDGRFERVGGNTTIHSDVRIVAATNQNLEKLIAEDRFRKDLYYRLKVFTIHAPPLRNRREDIPRLVEYFAKIFSRELAKRISSVSPDAMDCFIAYDWPGNVRELQGVIKYAFVQATSDLLTTDCLPLDIRVKTDNGGFRSRFRAGDSAIDVANALGGLIASESTDIYRQVHQAVDEVLLPDLLKRVGGNQVQASRVLGISRTTLRAKLREVRGGDGEQANQDQA